tara:strand:+ start:329 stop:508 length:180 start_codon:yes stop_codon:yes gene_type:complete
MVFLAHLKACALMERSVSKGFVTKRESNRNPTAQRIQIVLEAVLSNATRRLGSVSPLRV